ncbi:MAG: ABC transporter substrate-binding protein [Rhodocyclaceae bacterium]|nr:ABC transporter substrate-binding protein [Rhodocyclaceae bacterium]
MKLVTGILILASSIAFSAKLGAQEIAPDTLIRNVSNEVLDIVRKDKDIQAGHTSKAIDLIESKVLPHFNFMRMTQLAVGKDWRQANSEQQKTLANEFHTLLVRTYSKALSEYRNEKITIKALTLKPEDTDARVRTEISQANSGKPIGLDYYMEKSASGWKVYDIEIGGVSLITNYRETFGSEIRRSGVDGLIKLLQSKNQSAEGATAKK